MSSPEYLEQSKLLRLERKYISLRSEYERIETTKTRIQARMCVAYEALLDQRRLMELTWKERELNRENDRAKEAAAREAERAQLIEEKRARKIVREEKQRLRREEAQRLKQTEQQAHSAEEMP